VNLQSGFNQIPELSAFNTRYGQYEYLFMPFGLRNAPSTFQRVINIVLKDLVDRLCVIYLDDILIYSRSVEEHLEHLDQVLSRLEEYSLIVNSKKSRFFLREVEYCGFIVGHNRVQPHPFDKLKLWNSGEKGQLDLFQQLVSYTPSNSPFEVSGASQSSKRLKRVKFLVGVKRLSSAAQTILVKKVN